MVNSTTACRCSGWRTSEFNDFSTSLLHAWCEWVSDPFVIVECWEQVFTVDFTRLQLRIHGWTVVTEYSDVTDIADIRVEFEFKLWHGSIVVQSTHCWDWRLAQSFELAHCNECISVARVADYDCFQVWVCDLVECLAYVHKYLSVVFDEVCALHSFHAWFWTDQKCIFSIFEGFALVCAYFNWIDKWECTVVYFHFHTLHFLFEHFQVM